MSADGVVVEENNAPREEAPRGEGGFPRRNGGEGRSRGGYRPRGGGGKGFFRRKVCRFCVQNLTVNYKNPESLRRFVTERGKILPRRITGTCARHQRALVREIKRSRVLAFLPYAKR